MSYPHTNSASVAGVAEKLIGFSPLNEKESLTLESLPISFNQIQLIIFHTPGTVGYFFGLMSIVL